MFESNALKIQRGLVPEHVPEVYHFDKQKALIIMRYIAPPNLILRKHLIAGSESTTTMTTTTASTKILSTFAVHMGSFMARSLFGTSALAMDGMIRYQISYPHFECPFFLISPLSQPRPS